MNKFLLNNKQYLEVTKLLMKIRSNRPYKRKKQK